MAQRELVVAWPSEGDGREKAGEGAQGICKPPLLSKDTNDAWPLKMKACPTHLLPWVSLYVPHSVEKER